MQFGYIRVSTREQNEARQMSLMKKKEVVNQNIYIDKSTGKNFDRPNYQILKKVLRKGDSLLIVSIDRLGRNKDQCLKELRELKEKGVRVMIEDIPTTLTEAKGNDLLLDMINNILIEVYTTMAQEEVERIDKRRRQGMDSMRRDPESGKLIGKSGKPIGRPDMWSKLSEADKALIKSWIRKETKFRVVLKETGISPSTLKGIKSKVLKGEYK